MYGQQNMVPAAYPRPTLMARPVIGSYPHNHLNPTLVGFNSQGSVHSSIPQGTYVAFCILSPLITFFENVLNIDNDCRCYI